MVSPRGGAMGSGGYGVGLLSPVVWRVWGGGEAGWGSVLGGGYGPGPPHHQPTHTQLASRPLSNENAPHQNCRAAERSGPGCAELRGVPLAGGLQYTFVATALRSQPGAARPEGFSMHVKPADGADALLAGGGSSSSSDSKRSAAREDAGPLPAAGTRSTRTLLGALQHGVPWLQYGDNNILFTT